MEAVLVLLGGLGALGAAIIAGIGQEAGRAVVADTWDRVRGRGRRGSQLLGTWHALWQTTVRGDINFNTELIEITKHGATFNIRNMAKSAENERGGYLWKGTLSLRHDRHLVGTYKATEEGGTAHGTLFLLCNPTQQFLHGRWVGCNIDSELTTGVVVLARTREIATQEMQLLLSHLAQAPETHLPGNMNAAMLSNPQLTKGKPYVDK
jgi:hypothetical protein